MAAINYLTATNPRRVSRDDFTELFRKALYPR